MNGLVRLNPCMHVKPLKTGPEHTSQQSGWIIKVSLIFFKAIWNAPKRIDCADHAIRGDILCSTYHTAVGF